MTFSRKKTNIFPSVTLHFHLLPWPANFTYTGPNIMPNICLKRHFESHRPDTQTHIQLTDCSTQPLKWSVIPGGCTSIAHWCRKFS